MIARTWFGKAPQENAGAYVALLKEKVFKDIHNIDGYQGAYVLSRTISGNNDVEFFIITFWKSMEAIHKFAGHDPTIAVVEDEARALLSNFDEQVNHYDVLHSPG